MKLNIKKSRLEIHRTTKQKALEYLEYIPEELKEYQKGMECYETKNYSIESVDNLFKAIEHAQLIFLGDFHTFDQSSRNLERLLKTFFTKKKELILGVEFIHIKHQKYIDEYLSNIITEREFLESINYRESWRFPWIHYKEFFKLAKESNFKIIALNSEGTLQQRDFEAAKVISNNLNKQSNLHFFVLFGELHILPDRLPLMTSQMSTRPIQKLIIHQNLEEVYWRIYEEHEKKASESVIVKFSETEYSLQNSPPWIKYESMIYWYENLCDDPEFDLHDYIIETGLKSFDGNIYENFLFLCKQLNETLEFNLHDDELEDFNIYDHQSLETTLKKIDQSSLNEELKLFYENLIHRGELFSLPGTNTYYCPSYSINRISIIAGFHVSNLIQNKSPIPDSNEEILGYFSYINYVGYFSSKVFNPFRKCDLYIDLMKKAKSLAENTWQINCLKILRGENLGSHLEQLSLIDIFYISKQVGHIMADLSFYSSSDQNFIFQKVVNNLMNRCFSIKELNNLMNELVLQTPNFYQKTKVII
jgi:hypothetical protein